jgi:hypothetical protein
MFSVKFVGSSECLEVLKVILSLILNGSDSQISLNAVGI